MDSQRRRNGPDFPTCVASKRSGLRQGHFRRVAIFLARAMQSASMPASQELEHRGDQRGPARLGVLTTMKETETLSRKVQLFRYTSRGLLLS